MSADRELLELAAKAAGIELRWFSHVRMHTATGIVDMEPQLPHIEDKVWNPITDDGDRYRLAKKLDIRIHFGPCYVTYVSNNICGCVNWPENAKDDAYAIVQAAAEIGKAMP